MEIHLLDMGTEKYGDCVLITHSNKVILIDGAHPGDEAFIKSQLKKLLNKNPPFKIDLLVVTHCHSDHVGCLPAMVAMDYIRPKIALLADPALRWGEQTGEEDNFFADSNVLVQALQEEDRSDMDDAELEKFLSDAVDVLPDYKKMIAKLKADNAEVILYGGVEKDYSALENKFSAFGMKILGPTIQHLDICFQDLTSGVDAAGISDFIRSADSELAVVQAYRQLTERITSDDDVPLEDAANNGAAVNDQSIVLKFAADGWSALLAGDMQWASAGVTGLSPHMKALLLEVNNNGPYDFIKLTHHTAKNGLNKTMLDKWIQTTKIYAHTGGSNDKGHPNVSILDLLEERAGEMIFGRTDSNGILTIGNDTAGKLNMWISKGDFNDFRPNNPGDDLPAAASQPITPFVQTPAPPAKMNAQPTIISSDGEVVEVTAKIPHSSTRVTITIDVEPKKKPVEDPVKPPPDPPGPQSTAGGRFDDILFITSTAVLKMNIGEAETNRVVEWVRQNVSSKFLDLPQTSVAKDAAALVMNNVDDNTKGIVIIGGYDVVPASQLDVLDPELRKEIEDDGYEGYDADNFIVWSDDIYGDREGDSLPELPVSRIPDGKSAELVFNALTAPKFTHNFKFGIRNLARNFAVDIYDTIPASTSYNLEVSEKCSPTNIEVNRAQGAVYYMLHGADHDATRFWGETKGGTVYEAFDINNIPESTPGTVIFAGCCWGALTVQPAAYRYSAATKLRPRTPEQSIALAYLKAGALGFVGCTGTHYSPQQEPFNFFGRPMHDLFWKGIREGQQPALALFNAKQQYAVDIPHGLAKSFSKAIEIKILREFTCLGLGW